MFNMDEENIKINFQFVPILVKEKNEKGHESIRKFMIHSEVYCSSQEEYRYKWYNNKNKNVGQINMPQVKRLLNNFGTFGGSGMNDTLLNNLNNVNLNQPSNQINPPNNNNKSAFSFSSCNTQNQNMNINNFSKPISLYERIFGNQTELNTDFCKEVNELLDSYRNSFSNTILSSNSLGFKSDYLTQFLNYKQSSSNLLSNSLSNVGQSSYTFGNKRPPNSISMGVSTSNSYPPLNPNPNSNYIGFLGPSNINQNSTINMLPASNNLSSNSTAGNLCTPNQDQYFLQRGIGTSNNFLNTFNTLNTTTTNFTTKYNNIFSNNNTQNFINNSKSLTLSSGPNFSSNQTLNTITNNHNNIPYNNSLIRNNLPTSTTNPITPQSQTLQISSNNDDDVVKLNFELNLLQEKLTEFYVSEPNESVKDKIKKLHFLNVLSEDVSTNIKKLFYEIEKTERGLREVSCYCQKTKVFIMLQREDSSIFCSEYCYNKFILNNFK